MKLLCSCLSEQSANTHTPTQTHTHPHIQRHTRALPAAVFVVPPALPQRTQQQQPDANALPTQAAAAQPAATVLSLSLPLCVRAWTIENDQDTVKNTKERTHAHARTHT